MFTNLTFLNVFFTKDERKCDVSYDLFTEVVLFYSLSRPLSVSLSLFSTLSLLSANNLLLPLLSNFPQLSVNSSRVVTLEFGRKRESEAFKSSVCVFIRFHFSQLLLSTLCQLVLEVFSELAKLMRLTPCVFVQRLSH